ncbi:MAG: 23S rRNA (adenine(2503)-C(2))-methyltransferase RlmN [Gemmatimonadaceae bacterium]|nr:23S rRNA (adenine(2503)-C(2))-methyltransferase RlmN [Gemmatimonadaceae bacterium]
MSPSTLRAPDDPRPSLLDLAPDDVIATVGAFFAARGEPAYRTTQLLRRLWERPAASWDDITELPKALRDALADAFRLPRLEIVTRQRSTDGTEKFLFRLHDGQTIETVAIPDGDRMTFCISSQAGCALKCAFCATGVMGFQRNLTAGEIAGQVRELALLDPPILPTTIVFMGMGEPLMNWSAVDTALTLLNDPRALGIGARHITVSTVGVLPGIEALAARPEQFRLAISVHAPFDDLRHDLMPINVKYPLSAVIDAARRFDRRVTFEYVMLGGVNDRPEDADALAHLARDCRAFVNLIPLHPGGALGFHPTPAGEIRRFAARVRERGVEVAIRRSRGLDIAAACGQLRTEKADRRPPVAPEANREVELT